jgi:BirA family transcriptional regulator, biotin operon repressor / biotin---[acetyl-CoA-carboxylase] ligase
MSLTPLVHRFDRLSSTQDELHRLAAAGAPAGTVVVAAEQEAGRGSRGRRWASPLGGLWLSFLCRPPCPVGVEVLSVRVGLGAAEALSRLGGLPPVALKWPNDLILGDRKIGGILGEARWQGDTLAWVAVGVGINVRNPLPVGVRTPPGRLADWRPDLEPEQVLEPVLARLAPLAVSGTGLTPAELEAFGRRDWLAGRELAGPVQGRATGIAADGSLLVRLPDGSTVGVSSGPVVLPGEAA